MNVNTSKYKELIKVSTPQIVYKKAKEIYGPNVDIDISPLKNKKYRILDSIKNKYVDFGDIRYQDFTKHKEEERRIRYLKRALNIRGDWAKNPFSKNWLAISLLW